MTRPQRTTITLAIEQPTIERIEAWRTEQLERLGLRLSMNAAANAMLRAGLDAQQNDFQTVPAGT
ncbi:MULTISPECIES: hypothetical protein [Burkholderia]|uniref:hypothetical protein n=1 Tax=Burkholderia TaxID=32008 RepID=UPI0008418C8D|nr:MULTISPECIES: hypothetical protein [unclassified Burkholderia]AOK29865.1 hypothetical protein AQ611_10955 [Burkholderia sp. Bp7605]